MRQAQLLGLAFLVASAVVAVAADSVEEKKDACRKLSTSMALGADPRSVSALAAECNKQPNCKSVRLILEAQGTPVPVLSCGDRNFKYREVPAPTPVSPSEQACVDLSSYAQISQDKIMAEKGDELIADCNANRERNHCIAARMMLKSSKYAAFAQKLTCDK